MGSKPIPIPTLSIAPTQTLSIPPTQPKSREISLVNPIFIQGLPALYPAMFFLTPLSHFPDPSFPSNPSSIVQSFYLLHQSITCYCLIIIFFTFSEFRIQILSHIRFWDS